MEENMKTDYALLSREIEALILGNKEDYPNMIANLANASAVLWQHLSRINWVGFYLLSEDRLIVGPFQGKPACREIMPGKGVCGTALAEDRTQLVPDVHQFPGHIACDENSRSEIVIPLHHGGSVMGVLDIDSPLLNRFNKEDQEGLEKIAIIIEKSLGEKYGKTF